MDPTVCAAPIMGIRHSFTIHHLSEVPFVWLFMGYDWEFGIGLGLDLGLGFGLVSGLGLGLG